MTGSPPAIPRSVIAGLFLASIALRPQVLAIGPLLPIIRTDLDLSASIAALLTTFPVLCMGLFAPVGPRLAARLGPRLAFAAWLTLVSPDPPHAATGPVRAPRIPWRSRTGWLLVFLFGAQSLLFYGASAWLPNLYVEHGWSVAAAGTLVAWLNGIGLLTTIGVPLVADRLGGRRWQLVASSSAAVVALVGIALVPDPAYLWVSLLGLALGIIFPLVLTLPIDVADDPAAVGSVAALMLLGGYSLSSLGPFALGLARDATGDFGVSVWLLVGVAAALTAGCLLLSPARLRRGIRRAPVLSSAP